MDAFRSARHHKARRRALGNDEVCDCARAGMCMAPLSRLCAFTTGSFRRMRSAAAFPTTSSLL